MNPHVRVMAGSDHNDRRVRTILSWVCAITALHAFSPGPVALISAQTSDRPDGMRFVPNVEEQFRALADQLADPLGFHIDGSPDPGSCRHYQGITRVDGADGTPFFVV